VTLSVRIQLFYTSLPSVRRTPTFAINLSQSITYERFGKLGTVLALYTVLATSPFILITFIFMETDK